MPLLPILTSALSLLETLLPLIANLRQRVHQSGELTPEQEIALDQRIQQLTAHAHWRPDGE
jgi:hypothetical protein